MVRLSLKDTKNRNFEGNRFQEESTEKCLNSHAPLLDVHHVELWVEDAHQTAGYFRNVLGFTMIGFAGPRTGCLDRLSCLLVHDFFYVILSSGINSKSPVTKWVGIHGEGLRDIALLVRSVEETWRKALEDGVRPIESPHVEHYWDAQCYKCVVAALDHTVHTLISDDDGTDKWFGAFKRVASVSNSASIAPRFDHIRMTVEWGGADGVAKFYENVFGMAAVQRNPRPASIHMQIQVLQNTRGSACFVVAEPLNGEQTEDEQRCTRYRSFRGVQHIAFATSDILALSRHTMARGVKCSAPQGDHNDLMNEWPPEFPLGSDLLRRSNVLLDRDERGYLFRYKPRDFIELIQRGGIGGFGLHNASAASERYTREREETEPSGAINVLPEGTSSLSSMYSKELGKVPRETAMAVRGAEFRPLTLGHHATRFEIACPLQKIEDRDRP